MGEILQFDLYHQSLKTDIDEKECTSCGVVKPLSDFHEFTDKRRGIKGHRWACKACAVSYVTQWAAANQERVRAGASKRYHRRKKDPVYLEKKRKSGRESARRLIDLYPNRKVKQKESYLRARERDVVRFLFNNAKARAKQRGLAFDLTLEWCRSRWTGSCELTGIAFQQQIGRQGPYSPSIDKRNPIKGYTQENCRFILSAVNSMKGAGSDQDIFEIATALMERK